MLIINKDTVDELVRILKEDGRFESRPEARKEQHHDRR